MTIVGGILPWRKPGSFISWPSLRACISSERCTSSAGISASTRTREWGSSVTVVLTAVAIGSPYRHGMRRPRPPHVVVAAWVATGPLGHFYAGVADWIALLSRWRVARAADARCDARLALSPAGGVFDKRVSDQPFRAKIGQRPGTPLRIFSPW